MKFKILMLLIMSGVIFVSPIRDLITMDHLTLVINQIKEEPLAPLYYVLLYVVGVVFAVPGIALTILAGPIFGLWKGILVVLIGANLGCQITFFLSRFLGRDFVYKFVKADSLVDRLSKKIENNGFWVILSLRLLPVFPFNVINYVSGLTSLRYRDYTLGNFFGMLPGTCVYVYFSYTASDVKDNPWNLAIAVVMLILFTLVVTVIKKKVKRFGEDT